MSNKNEYISIVIPCRNEEEFIGSCLDSVLRSNIPSGMFEILVVDGMSTDKTREIIKRYAEKQPAIKLLENPAKIVPSSLNMGIKKSKGEIIVRLDAHSDYSETYISDCIRLLHETQAGNAGGCVVTSPNGTGQWAVPISYITSHRFGVGNGAFRVGGKPGFVDTVPFGVFPKTVFNKIGFFDERLTRNQDNEFNARLRKYGYKIAFDPAIRTNYKNQATLGGLMRQAFFTGMWNVYTLVLHPYTFQWRRFIPSVFVVYLTGVALSPFAVLGGFIERNFAAIYLIPFALYGLLNLYFSSSAVFSRSVSMRIGAAFFVYHACYGTGTLFGILNLLLGTWKKYLGKSLKV